MTSFEKQHSWRSSLTVCRRCAAQPGSHDWPKSWLQELTIVDGVQAVHAALCRRPGCGFGEIIGLRAGDSMAPLRRAWLRAAVSRHPLTFAAAAVVNGIVIGVMVALR